MIPTVFKLMNGATIFFASKTVVETRIGIFNVLIAWFVVKYVLLRVCMGNQMVTSEIRK